MIRGLFIYAGRYLTGDSAKRRQVRYEVSLRVRGIDFCGVELDELKLSEANAKPHSPSGGPDLENMLDALGLSRDLAAVDLGCGKGVAILTLSKRFRRVDGVDLSPELLEVAARNFKKCGLRESRLIHANAADFQEYDDYNVIYMNNPFPASVMAVAMRNLAESLRRAPRPLWVIYKNPKYGEAVTAAGFRPVQEFATASGDFPFRIYRMAE